MSQGVLHACLCLFNPCYSFSEEREAREQYLVHETPRRSVDLLADSSGEEAAPVRSSAPTPTGGR